MIGTSTPSVASRRTIAGTAAAASSLFTVPRTSALRAAASAASCRAVPSASAVSVLVMDWTAMGWSLPTSTPSMSTVTVLRRVPWGMPKYRCCGEPVRVLLAMAHRPGGPVSSATNYGVLTFFVKYPVFGVVAFLAVGLWMTRSALQSGKEMGRYVNGPRVGGVVAELRGADFEMTARWSAPGGGAHSGTVELYATEAETL